MELWIRSQDRKLLCRPNKIFIDEYFEKDAYGRFEIRSDWGVLGIYTEQKALEVLDEIQEKVKQFNIKTDYGCTSNVYEMPKEQGI